MRWRGLLALLALALSGVAPHDVASAADCPGPRCPAYEIACDPPSACRWATSRGGTVSIPYWVDYRQQWLDPNQVIRAVRASAAVWEHWNPRIRFVYKGTTQDPPISDCRVTVSFQELPVTAAVINWAPVREGPTREPRLSPRDKCGHPDLDMVINRIGPFLWAPCRQANNSCVPIRTRDRYDPSGSVKLDTYGELQQILVHEFGHILGLGDLSLDEHIGLTMMTGEEGCPSVPRENGSRYVCRARTTLGLGDILGARFLYPWRCPRLRRGATYPPAYRDLCPTISVFSP